MIHTHYDNLKVARNAPPEVIRAAYRSLCQLHHPDKNNGNPEADRVMAIINTSYEVLSDPERRQEHDNWIEQQEQPATQTSQATCHQSQSSKSASNPHPYQNDLVFKRIKATAFHMFRFGFFYVMAVVFIYMWATDNLNTPPAGPKPYSASPPQQAPAKPVYVRSESAPNGQPWPIRAAYVKGYERLHSDGLSTVAVDNGQNDSDVFIKLVSLDGEEAYPVRQFFIPAFGSFTVKNINAGSYDIRYRDLSNGGLSRSEAFNLEEISTDSGTQYSNFTMTLYKVQNGNMQTYDLSEAEF
jgi:curved DNA-binding protein CbpA